MTKQTDDSSFGRAAALGALACISIGLTALAAGAQEGPREEVEAARQTAERAAATEYALKGGGLTDEADSAEASDDDARPARSDGSGPDVDAADGTLASAGQALAPAKLDPLPDDWAAAGLDPDEAVQENGKLVQTLSNGLKVELTIDPAVQSHLEEVLDDYDVPHGGIVLIEPETGRVLAMVDRTDKRPKMADLARKAPAPSASVFKVVTAAALIESAGMNPSEETCYHGGTRHLTAKNIKGDPSRDHKCADLGDALAWSINSIVAKRAYHHLEREDLQVWARRFGYNTEIPFELPVEKSSAEIVEDPLERARTAAGFWHTYLSPLHSALIGAAVENDGLMMRPSIIERVTANGTVLQEFEPTVFRRVMSSKTADILAELLQGTTSKGTARKYFGYRAAFPNNVVSAGKTGTLTDDDPYLSFTWFSGFARHRTVQDRDVAVGALICNTPKWRIKGPWAASEAVRKFFDVRQHRAERKRREAAKEAELAAAE